MPQNVFLPVFEHVEVVDYELYRTDGERRLAWDFLPGPNALLGVNGLGKSTLINIVFRLLSGPYDLNRRALEGDLGQPDTNPVPIPDRRMFARRVSDQAAAATARLTFRLGTHKVEIERSLADLQLKRFVVDGESRATPDDDRLLFHSELSSLMGLGSFFDALLLLRFLVFVFEERRSLVWDESAQRQIFRATSLAPNAASRFLTLQRDIVEADSEARNVRVQANKAARLLNEAIANLSKRDSSLAQLQVGEEAVQALRERQGDLTTELEDLDADSLQERRNRMRAEHERDDILRQLDGAKLSLLRHLFGGLEPAARLSLLRTLENGICACCGQSAPELRKQISDALEGGACPLCGQPVPQGEGDNVVTPEEIGALEERYVTAMSQSAASVTRMAELDRRGDEIRRSLAAGERELNSALTRQNSLRRSVQVEPDDITRRRYAVDALTSAMNEAIGERKEAENDLRSLVEELEEDVRNRQEGIAASFARFAGAFMRETCSIAYIGRDARVGQEGARFRWPAFQVALSGGAVAGSTLRDNPGSVSLSQREYIDIAFRMAMMDVVTPEYGTSLVVDTPEAGLDFLFAERAGQQFLEFATNSGGVSNRVIVTSNLVSKHLLEALLSQTIEPGERKARLVNLISHAAPTAAIRSDLDRYEEFYQEVVDGR